MIDIKCIKKFLFELKMHNYRWRLVLRTDPILGPHNDLQTVGGCMIKNRNGHQTQFPGYADTARYGRL